MKSTQFVPVNHQFMARLPLTCGIQVSRSRNTLRYHIRLPSCVPSATWGFHLWTADAGTVAFFRAQGGIHEWQKAEQEIATRIVKPNTELRELYRSLVIKRELSTTAKLSGFMSVFVTKLIFCCESGVMTETALQYVKFNQQR